MDSNKQEFENIISDLKKDIRDREAKETEYLMLLDNSKKDLSTIATENETFKFFSKADTVKMNLYIMHSST